MGPRERRPRRASTSPRPPAIAPAARNGQNGSPYPIATTVGTSDERLR